MPSKKDVLATEEMLARLQKAGISREDAESLRRISITLDRWHHLEMGDGDDRGNSWSVCRGRRTLGGFEYDENGSPYVVKHWRDGKVTNWRINDREKGAQKRLGKIMARYPGFQAYVQGDVRGCALYVLRPGDVREGCKVDECYSNGIAVYR